MDSTKIYERVMEELHRQGVIQGGYLLTSNIQWVVDCVVSEMCAAFEARTAPYIEALQLVGNQVDAHNHALKELVAAPEPVEPERVFWDCYCGTRNAAGRTCMVCDRRA